MTSKMFLESTSTPSVIARQLSQDEDRFHELGVYLQKNAPAFIATVARGSSDHACSYAAYMITAQMGIPVMSLPPSVVTLYQSPLKMRNSLAIGVSQSGKSPDIVSTFDECARSGAKTVAFINVEDSPLAKSAEFFFPLYAGSEQSVAATKSFIASLAAIARFVGHWSHNQALLDALKRLPEILEVAQKTQLSQVVELFHNKKNALVLGRGPSCSIAMEAALKFKETCSIQAEAFSSAEVKHGPKALIEPKYPILMFAPRGPAQKDIVDTAKEMRALGADVLLISTQKSDEANIVLPCAGDPWLDPLVIIQVFHLAVEQLARERGMNPDNPPHLNKVTLTV
ncbi:MAG: SIS domain-containing protein [Holophagaceae bacterium]|nr:SIS domain-containing protein [Holophagaceae bacterium]